MDILHDILNIVVPLVTLILILLIYSPYVLYKFLSYQLRSITMENVKGKVVLITGASSGIGEYVAYEYARRGARLVLAARREDRLLAVADKAKKLGAPDAFVLSADVSNVQDCKKLIDDTIKHFGQLDHLVNNAGIDQQHCLFKNIRQMTDFTPVMNINFWGTAYCTHFAVAHLMKSKGKLVAITSAASGVPTPRLNIYSASKAAIVSLYETLRTEFGPDVGVTIVLPGLVESEMTTNDLLLETGMDFIPKESTERCAKAIVNSTCRGDMYLTEPRWVSSLFLLKLLFPELVEWSFRLVYVKRRPGRL